MMYFPSFLEATGVGRFPYKSKFVFIKNQSVKYGFGETFLTSVSFLA